MRNAMATTFRKDWQMEFSTQTETLVTMFPAEEAIDILLDAGYPCLDMSLFGSGEALVDGDWKGCAAELRKRVEDRGARFNQAHAPFGGGCEYYTGTTVPRLPRFFDFAAALGAEDIVVHPLQDGPYHGNEKALFERNVEFYRALAPAAKDAGLKIAIENMWQCHKRVPGLIVDDVCAPPDEHAALLDALDDPMAFTICLDIGHAAICGFEPDESIRTIGGTRLGALHVHDVNYRQDNHTLPGIHNIDWDAVCRALGEVGYKGVFTLEADNFLKGFGAEFARPAARFMAERAKFLADKVDSYRAAK